MTLNRLTIRARITIGTLLLAGIFFAAAAFAMDRAVEGILFSASETVLRSDAAPYEAAISGEPGEALDTPAEGQLVAVMDPTGTVAVSNLPASITARLGSLPEGESAHELETPDASYLVLVEETPASDGTWTIYTARNEAASQLVRDGLGRGLAVGFAVLTLLFGVLSWLLTGASLRPVARLRASAEVLASSDGRGSLPVGAARDEVHDLAVTLNSLIDGLHAAAERERQMVSDASHELRTPLAVLQAQLELIRTGKRDHLDEDLAAAERAVSRLSRLSSTLLELSRIEASTSNGMGSVEEMAEELVAAVDRARFSARTLAVDVDYSLESTLRPGSEVAIDPHDFGRIVDNLLDNAVRAVAKDGTVVVRLTTGVSSLRLTITDTGRGMSPEFLPRAFDRFARQSESREGDRGTGLGLAIVRALVDRAGGSIRLENTDGSGLRATVELPVKGVVAEI